MAQDGEKEGFSAENIAKLMHKPRTAALSTLSARDKSPYVSLVTVASDDAQCPIILISDLAVHTKNLREDDRASLLFDGTHGYDQPLTGPRVTALGRFTQADDDAARASFLAKHPDAELYADFADFSFWRMDVETFHAIAGFGRIETLDAKELFDTPSS